MTQHPSEQEIQRYRNRELSPAETLSLDDHLASCGSCHASFDDVLQPDEASAQVVTALQTETDFGDNHLSYEQMDNYVDQDLSGIDREIVDSHLEFCNSCNAEVQDLLAMKARLAELPGTRYSPGEPSSLWARVTALWNLPSVRIPLQAAAAVALVALIAWAAVLYSRKRAEEARLQAGHPEKSANPAIPSPEPGTKNPPPEPQDQNNAPLVVDLIDGSGHVALGGNDKLSGLESAPLQIQNEVKSALKSERVKAPPFVSNLKGQPGQLMGSNRAAYGLLNPVATAVESATPTFRWNAVEGAENYTVTIYDASSKKVLTSGPVLKNIWKASTPLGRGHTYSWQVRASKDGGELLMPPPAAPDAKFRIVEQNKLQEIQLARKSPARSHLMLAVVYADAGLLDQSERELQELLDANPKSPVARNLLRSAKALRR